ncbi:hypothetical protein V6N13_069329 [Hibiscus sabdariffa]
MPVIYDAAHGISMWANCFTVDPGPNRVQLGFDQRWILLLRGWTHLNQRLGWMTNRSFPGQREFGHLYAEKTVGKWDVFRTFLGQWRALWVLF